MDISISSQKWLLWIGIVLAIIYWGSLAFLMEFLPPPSPLLSADQVVSLYADNNLQFRVGVVLQLTAFGFFLPWTIVFAIQMAREESGTPVLAILQILAGTIGTMLFVMPPIFFAVACFSPERAPELTKLMHELAWLTLIAPAGLFPLQAIPIGVVAFVKKVKESESAFPRWLGYFSFWLSITALGGVLAVLFKQGPFAWNGLFPFYLPLIIFSIWVGVMMVSMLKSLNSQKNNEDQKS